MQLLTYCYPERRRILRTRYLFDIFIAAGEARGCGYVLQIEPRGFLHGEMVPCSQSRRSRSDTPSSVLNCSCQSPIPLSLAHCPWYLRHDLQIPEGATISQTFETKQDKWSSGIHIINSLHHMDAIFTLQYPGGFVV
jgi:hypothetical protein